MYVAFLLFRQSKRFYSHKFENDASNMKVKMKSYKDGPRAITKVVCVFIFIT